MNWIKLPLVWQVGSGSTLFASLSIHGLILILPLAAQKEPPKPETLATIPIAELPAEPTAESSSKLPESEPTVQAPPPASKPSIEEFEPLFDQFPSRKWSSFPERVESFPRGPEEPVEELETEASTENTSDTDSSETEVRQDIDATTESKESTEPETPPQKTRVDQERQSLKPKPNLQPSQPPPANEESPEVVKGQLQDVLGKIRGEGTFDDVRGIDILTSLYGVQGLDQLKEDLTTDNKQDLKPEIDQDQFRFIADRNPDEVYEELSQELAAQNFSITPIPTHGSGVSEGSALYKVKKESVVSYVNLVELNEKGTLFVVWNRLPS
jgi:hypothetical protein